MLTRCMAQRAAGGAVVAGADLALNGAAQRSPLHAAVPLRFSWTGLAILLGGCAVVLVAVALALGRVLRLSAREALAYE